MSKRVYIETTIPSYLTSRPSRDIIRAAQQQQTRDWWEDHASQYDLFISQLVVDECYMGDTESAARRLAVLGKLARLEITDAVGPLVQALQHGGAIPSVAGDDAAHISIAAVHSMDFLLTWNCTQIANAMRAEAIRSVVEASGYRCPVICTPTGLLGERS